RVPPARLTRLDVRDFRNLARVELAPPPSGFVVIGENGQGKTNLLESIYYLQILRSARGARSGPRALRDGRLSHRRDDGDRSRARDRRWVRACGQTETRAARRRHSA